MIDIVDKQTRSRMMSNIGPADTEAELIVRRHLRDHGFGYRLHVPMGPAPPSKRKFRPDIYLSRYNAVILVHGCYWHRHKDCKFCTTPDDPTEAWRRKFELNQERDKRQIDWLINEKSMRVMIAWECAFQNNVLREQGLEQITDWIRSQRQKAEYPLSPLLTT